MVVYGLVELKAEPSAVVVIAIIFTPADRPELSYEEVLVICEPLITRSHRPLTLEPSLHRPSLLVIEDVQLHHL